MYLTFGGLSFNIHQLSLLRSLSPVPLRMDSHSKRLFIRRSFVSEQGKSSLFRNVYFILIHLRWNLAALQSCWDSLWNRAISFIKSWLSFCHRSKKIGIYQEIHLRPSIFYTSGMSPLLMNDNNCNAVTSANASCSNQFTWLHNCRIVGQIPTGCNSYNCWRKRKKGD